MKKSFLCLIICFIFSFPLMFFAGCNKEKVPVEAITLQNENIEFFLGQTRQLKYDIFPKEANDYRLEFSSSNERIVTIDNNGYMTTYKNYGSAYIRIKEVYSGITAQCLITVTDGRIYGIKIDTDNFKIEYAEGSTFNDSGLLVYLCYESGVEKIADRAEYEIIAPDILTENTIVKVKYGSFTKNINIFVHADTIQGIEISNAPDKTEYIIGENFNSDGMTVSLCYESGKKVPVSDYTVISSSLNYGDIVTIKYEDFMTTYKPIIKAKYETNYISTLQTLIDNAQDGDSIMLKSGNYVVNFSIDIPKDKNILIIGEDETYITTTNVPVFNIISNSSNQGNLTIENLNLTVNDENKIFYFNTLNSNCNLNNFNLNLKRITCNIDQTCTVLEFSSKEDISENIDITFDKFNIICDSPIASNLIKFNSINNSSITIKDSNFNEEDNFIFIEDCENFNVNFN